MNLGFNKATYHSRTLSVIIPKLDKCLNDGISYMNNHEPTKNTVHTVFFYEKKFDLFRVQIDNYIILPIETKNLESKYRKIKEIWLNNYEKSLKERKERKETNGE